MPLIETGATEFPAVYKYEPQPNPNDQDEMYVNLIIRGNSPSEAYNFALAVDTAEFGLKIAKKEGLQFAGLSERGKPVPCDENGDVTQTVPKPSEPAYYAVSHRYLGGE